MTEDARNGVFHEILYADEPVLICRENFSLCKVTLENKGKILRKIDLCGMSGNRVMANSIMCTNVDFGFTKDARKRGYQ